MHVWTDSIGGIQNARDGLTLDLREAIGTPHPRPDTYASRLPQVFTVTQEDLSARSGSEKVMVESWGLAIWRRQSLKCVFNRSSFASTTSFPPSYSLIALYFCPLPNCPPPNPPSPARWLGYGISSRLNPLRLLPSPRMFKHPSRPPRPGPARNSGFPLPAMNSPVRLAPATQALFSVSSSAQQASSPVPRLQLSRAPFALWASA